MTSNPESQSKQKERVGIVVSDSPNKTIVVRVERRFAHPLYGKVVTRSKKFYAHDENNEAKAGDQVRIEETRPMSKLKRWRLIEIIKRAAAD